MHCAMITQVKGVETLVAREMLTKKTNFFVFYSLHSESK